MAKKEKKEKVPQTPEQLWKTARSSIGLIVILSFIGAAIGLFGGDMYFTFSVQLCVVFGQVFGELAVEERESLYYVIGVIMCLLTLIPYILGYFGTKKRGGWMIAVLVFWCIDTVIALVNVDVLGILLHALGIWELVRAIKVRKTVFAPAEPVRCPYCGAPVAPTARFCTSCGSPVQTQPAPVNYVQQNNEQ